MENISPKEILISVIFFLVALALAIFINPFIKDSMLDDVRTYQNALQVDEDANLYQYAKTTQVGNVLAFGKMKAIYPVMLPELSGQYGFVEKVTEIYTRKTRQVCNSHDSDGNCTSYRTEVYYEWDKEATNFFVSQDFEFLSVIFPCRIMDLKSDFILELSASTVSPSFVEYIDDNYIYENNNWWSNVGDLRFYYKTLPVEFYTSVFTHFDGQEQPVYVHYNQTRDMVIHNKETAIKTFNAIYYTAAILIAGALWYMWAHYVVEIV